MTDLDLVREKWERLAREDCLFYILSDLNRRYGRWTRDEFFAHGRKQVASVIARLDEIAPDRAKEAALDFGCGVGRCTEALSRHYSRVCGVDIAEEMVRQARLLTPDTTCEYYRNGAGLEMFDDQDFDLVYSSLAMQHIPTDSVLRYVSEFGRVLRSGGLMMIEIRNCDYARPSDFAMGRQVAASGMTMLDSESPDVCLARRR